MTYRRPQFEILARRLAEPRRFIQVVAGPRQVGKTTLVQQVADSGNLLLRQRRRADAARRGRIAQQWEAARLIAGRAARCSCSTKCRKSPAGPRPSSACGTRTRAAATAEGRAARLRAAADPARTDGKSRRALRDAAPAALVAVRCTPRSADQLEQYLSSAVSRRGAAGSRPPRWARYVRDCVDRDHDRARCAAALARGQARAAAPLFELGCRYSGQILSYTKMLGRLQDAGNTTTLAHYLELLARRGDADRAAKFAGRRSAGAGPAPSCRSLNTALMTALWADPTRRAPTPSSGGV